MKLFLQAAETRLAPGVPASFRSLGEKAKTISASKGIRGSRAVGLLEDSKGKICVPAESDLRVQWKNLGGSADRIGQVNAMLRRGTQRLGASNRGRIASQEGSWMANDAEADCPATRFTKSARTSVARSGGDRQGAPLSSRGGLDPPFTTIALRKTERVYPPTLPCCAFMDGQMGLHSANRLLFSHRLVKGRSAIFSGHLRQRSRICRRQTSFRGPCDGPEWNEEPEPQIYEFASIVPGFASACAGDRRVRTIIIVSDVAAVNRHLHCASYAEWKARHPAHAGTGTANQELLHSQKMRALGTLAAGIAHDSTTSFLTRVPRRSSKPIWRQGENPYPRRRIKTMVEQGSGIVKAMLAQPGGGGRKACDVNQLISETNRLLGDQFGTT